MTNKLQILIFSKDRALQLDSLLRSIEDNFLVPYQFITILYTYTNKTYREGYDKLKQLLTCKTNISWVDQGNFRDDLCTIVNNYSKDSLLLLLVDDNVFFRLFENVKLLDSLHGNALFVNLIFFRNDEKDKYVHVRVKDKIVSYVWPKHTRKGVYHCYPFSLDAHIYRVSLLKKIIAGIQFKAPNSLEGALHRCSRKLGVMWFWRALAPDQVVAFNNPLNSVQLEGSTWNQGVATEMLNEKFLEGYRIDNKKVYNAKPDQMHFYHPISLVKTSESLVCDVPSG